MYLYIYILSRETHNQQNLCESDAQQAQSSCVSRRRQQVAERFAKRIANLSTTRDLWFLVAQPL